MLVTISKTNKIVLQKEIGSGGWGSVFDIGNDLVLKEASYQYSFYSGITQKRIKALINHRFPCIVKIYDAKFQRYQFCCLMEKLKPLNKTEARSLDDWFCGNVKPTHVKVKKLLSEMKKFGIKHHDDHSDNFMKDKFGNIKMVDPEAISITKPKKKK